MVDKQVFSKILVANRGEIAVRIMRSAQELGLKVVAIYEETDKDAFHIMRADEAVCIGSGPRKDYLNIDKIILAAQQTGAQAIHPGYGFLAENPDFPEACTNAGLVFIGPPPEVIRNLGSKVIARKIAQATGVRVIPATGMLAQGAPGEEAALEFAATHGYPIMIKAVSGGGGRGIRQVEDRDSLLTGLKRSRSEALMSFGDDNIYLEKCVHRPRHVEVQILADSYGNVVHLGTRNCSIQRRHQKLIEIAPAGLDPALTAEICDAAVRAARAAEYLSAGTVEFLVEHDGTYYFLEVNTRLQVEHTVTEVLTGIDIVREQLLIAMGEPISFSQEQVARARLRHRAPDQRRGPQKRLSGQPRAGGGLPVLRRPRRPARRHHLPGVRITPYYDSLIVKLTVYGFTWPEAVDRMARALNGFLIIGVKTTIPYFQQIVKEPDFIRMNLDTAYIDDHPQLMDYREHEREVEKLARLIAEINAHEKNPYTQ